MASQWRLREKPLLVDDQSAISHVLTICLHQKEQRKALSLKMLYTLPFDLEMCFVITLPEVVLFGLLQPSAQERILDKETGKEQYRGTNQVPTTLLIVHHCDECNIAPALKKYILLEQVVNRHPNKKGQ